MGMLYYTRNTFSSTQKYTQYYKLKVFALDMQIPNVFNYDKKMRTLSHERQRTKVDKNVYCVFTLLVVNSCRAAVLAGEIVNILFATISL